MIWGGFRALKYEVRAADINFWIEIGSPSAEDIGFSCNVKVQGLREDTA